MRELKDKFDRGERPALTIDEHDVTTIASLLKQYLRELAEPLIPISLYQDMMRVSSLLPLMLSLFPLMLSLLPSCCHYFPHAVTTSP